MLTKLWLLVDSNNDNTIEKHEYYELHRRLLRALVGVVSVEEERVMCDEDWPPPLSNSDNNNINNRIKLKKLIKKRHRKRSKKVRKRRKRRRGKSFLQIQGKQRLQQRFLVSSSR